ncbi:MAG: arsenite methyltransferase [Planctomycetes bacterium]|nr:arsenite methyltransferase [Planctomycetota bacterium]
MTIHDQVKAAYAQVARSGASCCGPTSCAPADAARRLGYSEDEVAAGDGANLGLGCGNPTAVAELRPGEVVVDLGSGAGFDALLCARRVGPTGRVIGVDMTPEMLVRARENAARLGLSQVEFREGVIEDLPLRDAVADVVISNCVINLSPDKPRALAEALRVLKPGGRLRVSDVATTRPLSEEARRDAAAWTACLAGALTTDEYRAILERVGFEGITIEAEGGFGLDDLLRAPDPIAQGVSPALRAEADAFVSVRVSATRPATACCASPEAPGAGCC